jgi:D-alanine-D-alanine ligase
MKRKNVAIIAGGDSGEYEVSINSANEVYKHLSKKTYNPYLIIIKGQEWYYLDEESESIAIDKADFSLTLDDKHITFDVVFNVIHGTPGENGIIQGYFDLLGIPYTSCGLASSALTFNKGYCNGVVRSLGTNIANSIHLIKKTPLDLKAIGDELGFPVFVKPANGGSSVATSKVNEMAQLQAAIDLAYTADDEILIEQFIKGREIDCGAFNYRGKMMIFPITEIISKKEFFDYEAKYTEGMADEITPAQIPEEVEIECKAISSELYQKLNCKGVVRFDYIFNEEAIFFLEVNTVPGLSAASIIPKQATEMGIEMEQLFEMMIEDALNED